MNSERVTPKNAAKELQMDVITLRELMKREKLPIGYVIVDRLCEATTQLLEIIKKQEEIIEQCRISDELHKELDDMKNDVDQKMDLIEYDLRSYRREREE